MENENCGYPLTETLGSKCVQQLSEVEFREMKMSVIPLTWFDHLRYPNGQPHLPAIVILADIVYWYRPVEIRDSEGNVVEIRKRFAGDWLQLGKRRYQTQFHMTASTVRAAFEYLEGQGLIQRHIVKRLELPTGFVLGNVPYIELRVTRLLEITTPCAVDGNRCGDRWRDNTENTSENTSEDAPKKKRPIYPPRSGGPINYSQADVFALRSDRARNPAKKRRNLELAKIAIYEGSEDL